MKANTASRIRSAYRGMPKSLAKYAKRECAYCHIYDKWQVYVFNDKSVLEVWYNEPRVSTLEEAKTRWSEL